MLPGSSSLELSSTLGSEDKCGQFMKEQTKDLPLPCLSYHSSVSEAAIAQATEGDLSLLLKVIVTLCSRSFCYNFLYI